jgi:hypothetical protein
MGAVQFKLSNTLRKTLQLGVANINGILNKNEIRILETRSL